MQKSKCWKYSKAFSTFLLITIRAILHFWALHHFLYSKLIDSSKWRKTSTPLSMGALSRLSLSYFNMTQTVPPFIYGRFIIHFLWNKWIFQMTQAVSPSNYGRFIETLSWKWITFSTWRKTSTPSFVGASSNIFI